MFYILFYVNKNFVEQFFFVICVKSIKIEYGHIHVNYVINDKEK
jgi:hypothetical protein